MQHNRWFENRKLSRDANCRRDAKFMSNKPHGNLDFRKLMRWRRHERLHDVLGVPEPDSANLWYRESSYWSTIGALSSGPRRDLVTSPDGKIEFESGICGAAEEPLQLFFEFRDALVYVRRSLHHCSLGLIWIRRFYIVIILSGRTSKWLR